MTIGYMMKMRHLMQVAVKPVRDFHRVAPMVLGIISEKTRMRMVIMALTRPNQREPKRIFACWPTPAAPMVLAMVFKESMAAMGLEVSCLYRLKREAGLYPSSSRMVTYDIGVDMSVASRMEQRKEMAMAPKRKSNNAVIKV